METQQDFWWLEDFLEEEEERHSTQKMKIQTQKNISQQNPCKKSDGSKFTSDHLMLSLLIIIIVASVFTCTLLCTIKIIQKNI